MKQTYSGSFRGVGLGLRLGLRLGLGLGKWKCKELKEYSI